MRAIELQKEPNNYPMLSLRGKPETLTRPLVMGIVNLTPDSFYAASRVTEASETVKRVRAMIENGADIIDIGACSTRPGSDSVEMEEEWNRLHKPLEAVRKAFPEAILSIDTFNAEIAGRCLETAGVEIINDVSGGEDPKMMETVARHDACYILMHTRGTPKEMDNLSRYEDVTADVVRELAFRLDEAREKGLCNVIVDPGFGFAKTTEQNFELLKNLNCLKILGCPILAGISRKRMTRNAGEYDADDSLVSTIALNTIALMNGASIIRVHDVKEAAQTVRIVSRIVDI